MITPVDRQLPRPPIAIDTVFDDPAVVDRLIDAHQPYWPVQRYMTNRAEYATLSGGSRRGDPAAAMPVAPVFRGDWAVGGAVEDGVADILAHDRFTDAASELFDAEIVRPHTVYVNLTWQLPFAQGRGHVDIPAFAGFDRTTVPVTFLTTMGLSGLFDAERVKVATAVAWFYEGADGGFEYWPSGPSEPSVVHEGAIHNTAVVGDNDFMWHRVRPLGSVDDGMVSLTLDSELVARGDGTFAIVSSAGVDDGEVARFTRDRLRVSLSWKADVFVSEAEARRHDEHAADLDLDEVLRRFSADLASRGLDPTMPDDPLHDPELTARLGEAYMQYPT